MPSKRDWAPAVGLVFEPFAGTSQLDDAPGPASGPTPQESADAFERKKLSDDKRRAALKERHTKYKQQKRLVSDSLKTVDAGGPQPKHKRFSDSESEGEDDDGLRPDKLPSSTHQTTATANGQTKLALFDDDHDADDIGNGSTDIINIKPHLFGKKGAELMAHEAQFNGDDRFRLSEKFLDDGEDEDGDRTTNGAVETDANQQHEKTQNYKILSKILGTTITEKVSSSPAANAMVRFDPLNPQHYQYDLSALQKASGQAKAAATKENQSTKDRQKAVDSTDQPPQPTLTDTRRFHEMDSDFAQSLRKKLKSAAEPGAEAGDSGEVAVNKPSAEATETPASQPNNQNGSFSLLASLGRADLLASAEKEDALRRSRQREAERHNIDRIEPKSQSSEARQPTHLNTTASEASVKPTPAGQDRPITVRQDGENVRLFAPADSLLKEIKTFYCTQSADELRKQWLKYKHSIAKLCGTQRKDAARQVRQLQQLRDRFGQQPTGQQSAQQLQPVAHPKMKRNQQARQAYRNSQFADMRIKKGGGGQQQGQRQRQSSGRRWNKKRETIVDRAVRDKRRAMNNDNK